MVLPALLVVPSFAYLYWLQQHGQLEVTESSDELERAVAAETAATAPTPDPRSHGVDIPTREPPQRFGMVRVP
jgi:hypothetical protein